MSRNERRLARKRDNFEALFAQAATHAAQGRAEDAISVYRQALALRPDSAPAHNNLGIAFRALNRFAEAAAQFQAALAHDPQLAEVHNNLASVLVMLGQLDAAIAHYHRAVAIKADYIEARVGLATCYADRKQLVEALSHAEIASWQSENPSFPHFRFGVLMARCDCNDLARKCFETYLARDPDDRQGARPLLAKLGFTPLPQQASAAQLESLYERRARFWDTGSATYTGARLVAMALRQLSGGRTDLDILDAGCGTGLVGGLVTQQARRLEGVDLSPQMLAKAKAKGIYHQLHQDDLVALLRRRQREFDAVTCAATLIHFGELDAPFAAAATALRDDGLFVFTLFPNEQDDNAAAVAPLDGLGEGGCFVHGRGYIARVAQASGFTLVAMQAEVHEFAQGQPRMGLIVALRRNPRPSIIPAAAPAAAYEVTAPI
jgi:predicted TPR repeat methyltransferase